MASLKKGLFTSEFVTTIVTQIISFLVIIGVVDAAEANIWVDVLVKVIFGAISLFIGLAYIRGRIELKKLQMQNGTQLARG